MLTKEKQTGAMLAVFGATDLYTKDLQEVHQILFSCLRSVEVAMDENGIKQPSYVEHRVSKRKADLNPDYVPCRRCELCKPYKNGRRCTAFYIGPKREVYEVSEDDGCSRGIPKKHYQKNSKALW